MTDQNALMVLVGPTAVGKTSACVKLCRSFGAEVVGADSVQIYRRLDIGSAKPTLAEQALAPHHMVDVVDPDEPFDAARYVEMADRVIADLHQRGRRALVAGGTGLYIKALLHGLVPAPEVDPALRAELRREWEDKGLDFMHGKLCRLDPGAGERIHKNDRQRVLRALEVCIQTGRPFSERQTGHGFQKDRYKHLMVGLIRPREELFQRIAERSRLMWENGFVEEVRGLLDSGVPPDAKSLKTLGYRQVVAMLTGQIGSDEALEQTIRDTRAYAKRQLTWFKGMKNIHWHAPDDLEAIADKASEIWPIQV
ncbi:tRNA (adenosine(37)-N6)-dimethylallyltransferase MiaA [Dethiosulfatarculus sandiegensis]|uniref:tRNA dimethylallyltransferase n=1 Tax=Dethiosulfatarculus sandiegensis TaxID=1429043 RepID=A0A0D2JPM9_9BACT|nr:tRNA (adenosine(37)-N6)-dimethylallyltransferase MiaA [Dethiosulfatarculus sandiegensis]KIX11435.1 tRNA delta(2)-isopentenylpyrophosphate transferase [Dethiosulfatarculus sandiegensis]